MKKKDKNEWTGRVRVSPLPPPESQMTELLDLGALCVGEKPTSAPH